MPWRTLWRQDSPVQPLPVEPEPKGEEDIHLFPIISLDSFPVAVLLARGQLEEAGRLVSDRAWVASTPLYG